jgi:hypothetical protein
MGSSLAQTLADAMVAHAAEIHRTNFEILMALFLAPGSGPAGRVFALSRLTLFRRSPWNAISFLRADICGYNDLGLSSALGDRQDQEQSYIIFFGIGRSRCG